MKGSCSAELSGAMSDDFIENVATPINQIHAPITTFCSGTLVPIFTTLESRMKAQVSLEIMILPHDLVCYVVS